MTYLVTGALGAIGAWSVRSLLDRGEDVVTYDLGGSDHRLRLALSDEQLASIARVDGDVTDLEQLERVMDEHGVDAVIHLAALQVPFVRADPIAGARVNVTGTVNVFEAARRRADRMRPVVYASSIAAIAQPGAAHPSTLYGVFKLANEGTAAVFAADHSVASVGLRPFTVYGPGRDQGMTAGPTLAIAAAVRGEPYRIAFGGATQLHYAGDVARAFVQGARSEPSGAQTFCIGGPATSIADFVALLGEAVPGAEISFHETVLPFPDQLPEPWFDSPLTPLEDGVRETATILRSVV
jgi:nucleoside-diphosphate-sugar epimerase